MTAFIVLLTILAPGPAWAHGDAGVPWSDAAWTTDPWVMLPLYVAAILYLVGTRKLWRRAGAGRGVSYRQAACFWTGWLALVVALLSPLHWAGERLFTAHMIEHAILMVVAPPLIAAARPVGAALWALPRGARSVAGGCLRTIARSRAWRLVSHPLGATLAHGIAIWAWHAPRLYETVLENIVAHRLQHLTFAMTALLFWWSLLHGRLRARGYGISIFCLFVTSLHTGILGILLTLSRRLWYPAQGAFAAQFGLTPLEDQQLAGLMMGMPMGLVYTGVALALAARWIAASSVGPAQDREHVVPAR